jgi:two-component system chemotaxis sensor kinase CheA
VSNTLSSGANLLAFLERNARNLQSIKTRLATLGKDLENDHRALNRQVDDLLEETKRASMLPFSSLLGLFPKLVRDLCRDCGKDAELAIVGAEMEADRRILDEMKDPLIHLVRNCIDHGIENPTEREKRQKPSRASITIAITPKSGGKVEIAVSDDGAGIDVQKVRSAALGSGVISNDDVEKMDEREALSLMFRSGISTSPMIAEVSGRGLGLAIVQEKAEKVGGTVSVETQCVLCSTAKRPMGSPGRSSA